MIPGGSSAPVLPANIMMDITMDYDAIAKAGSMLGSGAVIVMDDTRCMVKSLLRLSYFYQHESCGQCTPCREGTGWLWRMVDRIEHGKGRMEDIELLGSVADNIMGRTICALGDAAAMPVRGMIKHFRDEFVHHVEHKRCVVGTAVSHHMIEIQLDGKPVSVAPGSMVMHAADAAGVYVPHFCYHKKLSIAANCRMCLVDIEKAPKPMPACATPVAQGMVVHTKSEKALKAQQSVMEFLLINHPLDCPICDQGGECQLQDLAVGYGGSASRYTEEKRVVFHKDVGPLISHAGDEPLHPLHALRALRPGGGRGDGTGHDPPRRAFRDHHRRRPHGRFRAVGQHDRHLPGRRADQQALPLQRAHLGAGAPPQHQPARLHRRQPDRADQGQPRAARRAAGERRRQRMLARRPRPLLL